MLYALGIFFLILIGLLLAFGIWLFIKVKSGMDTQARVAAIEEGMQLAEIVLEPSEQPSLRQPEVIAELVQKVTELGAVGCGDYEAPAAQVRVLAYCLETPPVYIAIYDHDLIDAWADVVLRFDQDRSFTASMVPDIGRGAPRHPEDEIVFFAPGTSIGVLVQAAAEQADGQATLAVAPEAFKAFFEEASEKSRQYIQTQSVSQDWLTAIAEDAGVELSGDEAEFINLMREDEQVTKMQTDCFASLAESGEFTAAQWNEINDSLVAVWDDMPGEYVAGVFYNQIDELPEELESAVDELEHSQGRARERIADLNAKFPEAVRLLLVGTVSSPVDADIYRGQMPIV